MLTTEENTFYTKSFSNDQSKEDIAGLHRGDETVVSHLYATNYKALCYFADKLIGNKSEAQDIAIDTFLKFLKKRADFHNYKDIGAFLFTAAKNACIDYLRKEKCKENAVRGLSYMSSGETLEDNEMLTARVLQAIYEEIENLPGQCRKIFKLLFFENKTTAAIAAELGISPQTVLNQKTKAIRLLRLGLLKQGLMFSSVYINWLIWLHLEGGKCLFSA